MVVFDKSKYMAKRLFADEHYENGFEVMPLEFDFDPTYPGKKWSFPESKGDPKWRLIQHYSGCCFVKQNKDVGSPYVMTDVEDTEVFTYHPEDKSITFQVNAQNIYKGKTEIEHYWPHLLIEQRDLFDYRSLSDEDKVFYSLQSDKIVAEFDMRITDYVPTTNPEGHNSCEFVAYAYLQLLGGNHIYLGYSPFWDHGAISHFWHKETGGANWIYALSNEMVYGDMKNSFCPEPYNVQVSEQWKHIEVDLTPHLDRIIEEANRDLIFGRPVARDEFYFNGTNIGFEVHGNISCTVEIKNYNLVSYVKKEK